MLEENLLSAGAFFFMGRGSNYLCELFCVNLFLFFVFTLLYEAERINPQPPIASNEQRSLFNDLGNQPATSLLLSEASEARV